MSDRQWQKPLGEEQIQWLEEQFAIAKARLSWMDTVESIPQRTRKPWWERA